MKGRYGNETKAAVMAALLEGQAATAVAAQYNIPVGTVRSWKSRQENGEGVAIIASEKKEEIGELLLGYLRESLTTLREQVKHFRDQEWLRSQDAGELAVLHGVQMDKAIRLLEALGRASDDNTTEG